MKRLDDWHQAARVAGIPPNHWKQLKHRKQTALAFGLDATSAPSAVPFDLDSAVLRVMLDFAHGLGVKVAGALVRLHWDTVLAALGRSDAEPVPVFLMALEDTEGEWRFAQGNLADVAGWSAENVATVRRLILLNVDDLLAQLRENGRKIGLDLSAPFFPPPGDELFEQVTGEGAKDRDEFRARVRTAAEVRT